jgi:hypothetical protein
VSGHPLFQSLLGLGIEVIAQPCDPIALEGRRLDSENDEIRRAGLRRIDRAQTNLTWT